jgi:hypothetical protein
MSYILRHGITKVFQELASQKYPLKSMCFSLWFAVCFVSIHALTRKDVKPLSLYIRDVVSALRQDTSFLSLSLLPTAARTVEKVIEASGLGTTLATVRESLPFILSHRLQMSPSLRERGENKEALILATMAVVPVPG